MKVFEFVGEELQSVNLFERTALSYRLIARVQHYDCLQAVEHSLQR
jgi:hypothetical protein